MQTLHVVLLLTARQKIAKERDTTKQERDSLKQKLTQAETERVKLEDDIRRLTKNHSEEVERTKKEKIGALNLAASSEPCKYCSMSI